MRFRVRTYTLGHTATMVRDYLPERPGRRPLLWIHGGAFAGGDIDMPESDQVARTLAQSGRHVRTLGYRLAPDFSGEGPLRLGTAPGRYPAAQDDARAAFEDLAVGGGAFLGGASAGACIAAGLAIRLRDEGDVRPVGLALAYGVYHSRLPTHTDIEGRFLTAITDAAASTWMSRMTLNYVGDEALLTDPRAFPGSGDLSGLPPALILDAANDILRASGKRFAQQLREASVPTTEKVVDGSEHGFLNDPSGTYFELGTTALGNWFDEQDAHLAPLDQQ